MKSDDETFTKVFREYFASNRGGVIEVGAAASPMDSESILLNATFVSGREYCCVEPGCHFRPDWDRLRSIASTHEVILPGRMRVTFYGTVEAGTILDRIGVTTETYGYTHLFVED